MAKKKQEITMEKEVLSFNSLKSLSKTEPIKAKKTKVVKQSKTILGILLFKISPLLFKKFSSSLKVILEPLLTMYGMIIKVAQNNPKLRFSLIPLNKKEMDNPILIPSQNIKFQKLSLFNRSLIQLIKTLKFKMYNFILIWFAAIGKVFTIVSIILTFNIINSVAFGNISYVFNKAEIEHDIPKGLLKAIASVESSEYPYALNISGKKVIAATDAETLVILKSHLKKGFRNIDIGVMQINYRWHGKNFASLEEIINPETNIKYAAKFLKSLYEEYGDWRKAVQIYHSHSPKYNKKYSRKIITAWLNS